MASQDSTTIMEMQGKEQEEYNLFLRLQYFKFNLNYIVLFKIDL